jgi:Flp pilus assembly pilin Flp
MTRALCRFARDERGHTTIEYGMIVTFIAIGIISSIVTMGDAANGMFSDLLEGWQDPPVEGTE